MRDIFQLRYAHCTSVYVECASVIPNIVVTDARLLAGCGLIVSPHRLVSWLQDHQVIFSLRMLITFGVLTSCLSDVDPA